MEWGRVAETDRMLSCGVDYAEPGCGKSKKWKEFSKPNAEPVPN